MKTFLLLLLLCVGAFAKDPKPKAPHVYITYGILNEVITDKDGVAWYTLFAKDGKGNEIVVGINADGVRKLSQKMQPTAISFDK